MSALDYQTLTALCDGRIGCRDCLCPACGPSRRSLANKRRRTLRVWYKERGFASYCCQRCGAQGYARDADAADHHHHDRVVVVVGGKDHAARQIEKARWLWSRREPIGGSPAEVYLQRARGYGGPLPATLGFLLPSRPGHHPALIGAFGIADEIEPGLVEIHDDRLHGVHLTLLKPDGSGKAEVEPGKFMVGPSKGWPIVVAPPNDLLGLAITEGIEDALSVHQATGLGCWAAGSAGRMPALAGTMPDYIECVTIYAHADEAGQRGAEGLADGLVGRGFEVFIEGASDEGIA